MTDDERWMGRCLELAAEAARRGNTPVGAVLVRDGVVLAEAAESVPARPDPVGHAELLALVEAARRAGSLDLRGAVLYSNAEPCVMCAWAIRRSRVARVVYGLPVELGGATSRYALLLDPELPWGAPPEVVEGVLREACASLRAAGRRVPG